MDGDLKNISDKDSKNVLNTYTQKAAFTEFCGRTSLHGWNNLIGDSPAKIQIYFWICIIILSLGITSCFLFTSVNDFTNKLVVTNIDTTTAPLHEVHFPSIIVCNINQIRKSILFELGIQNDSVIDLLYHQFYTGMYRDLTTQEISTIRNLATSDRMLTNLRSFWAMVTESNSTDIDHIMQGFNTTEFLKKYWAYIISLDFIRDMVIEDPGDTPVLYARYQHHQMRENSTDFLPFFGTDRGQCSIIKPQLIFNSDYDNLTYAQKVFGSNKVSYTRQFQAGVKVGKVNGLKLLLDAQTFDYTMNEQVSEGFKISANYHLDQPLMSLTEMDISPGFETQIAVTPVLYSTSYAAQNRFTPEERGCYFDHEISLTYLPKKWYRYSINNCLFEAAYEKVLELCHCTPFFHTLAFKKVPILCNGYSLLCMNQIMDQIGEYTDVEFKDGNNGQKRTAKCLEACEDQQNQVTVTTSRLPNRQTMLKWPEFCNVVEKLLKSCDNSWKRSGIDRNYPDLCLLLQSKFNEMTLAPFNAENKKVCMDILSNFNILELTKDFQQENVSSVSSQEPLLSGLFKYARENLAIVNIYIKPPVVTKILKDEKIPVIQFVANCGGILGLCMGCSLVTGFEVLYFVVHSLFTASIQKYKSYTEHKLKEKERKARIVRIKQGIYGIESQTFLKTIEI